jgi:hypothetical protein
VHSGRRSLDVPLCEAKERCGQQECTKDAFDVWTWTANPITVHRRECPHANAIHPARSILYERPTDVPTNSPTKRKLFAVVRSRPYQGWQTVVTAAPPPRNDHGRVARVLPPFSSPAPHAADVRHARLGTDRHRKGRPCIDRSLPADKGSARLKSRRCFDIDTSASNGTQLISPFSCRLS